MAYCKTKVAAVGRIEKNLFYLFLSAAILLLVSYICLWESSVMNIVARQRAVTEIAELSTSVSNMEAEYLALSSQKINVDNAKTLGFVDVTGEQNYALRSNKTVSLSVSSNEI